jgi:hypothetical protein
MTRPTPKTAEPIGRKSALVDDSATMMIHLVVDTMSPRYDAGDVLFVRPCKTVEAGHDYILQKKGSKPATLRLFTVERVTGSCIYGRQYQPAKVCRLSRRVWTPAYKVTGKYNRDRSRNALGK